MPLNISGSVVTDVVAKSIQTTNIVKTGLVLHLDAASTNSYPGTGTGWYDLTGNLNNCTLANSPTYSSNNGGSIIFNGTNQYARAANLNNTPSSYMTLLAWIKHTGDGALIWLGRNVSDANTEFGFSISSNKMNYWDYDNGYGVDHVANTTAFTTNTWNLIGITKSTTSFTFYLNGIANGTTTAAKDCTYSSNDFVIGCDIRENGGAGAVFFPGTISSVMVYNRTLSSTEILQNYNIQKSRFGL